ncbi:MAG: hypothetical protein ACYDH0_08210 [Candidatus Aminicenantales bacterium]
MRKSGRRILNTIAALVPAFFMFAGAGFGSAVESDGGAGYIMLGASSIDIAGLNTSLMAGGYSAHPRRFFSLGGGGHAVIGRLILGGEGQALAGRNAGNPTYRTTLSGGFGFFNLGYIVYSGEDFRIYPVAGIGAGEIDLEIAERGTASFDEVLENPGRGSKLSTSGFLLNLAIGAEKIVRLGGGRRGGLILGIRAGYVFAPVRGGWELEKLEIPGGPGISLQGPYVRVLIGAGSWGRRAGR